MILYLGEKKADGLWRCKWLFVNTEELQSKTSSTNWIILFNMAEWFYTQGDAVFRGSFSKSIDTSQYLKLYEGPGVIVLVLEPTICLTGAQIFILYVSNIWSGQNLASLGIFGLKRNLVQLVLVPMDQRQMWIQICNLKDGGDGNKDRDVWEWRGAIIIIRAS